jgi:hypothetical protein
MPGTWLDPDVALAMVEGTASANSPAWVADVEAAREWVEGKRKDLFTTTVPAIFSPGPMVKLGTAMLANRLYARRTSPLGTSQNVEFGSSDFLRQDPDIARLLGIGIEGKPVFGGARAAEIDALNAQAQS